MFWLKKFFTPFLLPLQLALLLGATGAVLVWTRRHARLGRILVTVAALLLLATANKWLSARLIAPLEYQYPTIGEYAPGVALPPALAACRYIVVLGGGHGERDDLPALSRLSTGARARLTEGIRLLRLLPQATLVVSGPGGNGGPTHAQVLADAAVSLGVDRVRIVLIEDARDTEEEAVRIRALASDTPVALVTSAWHLPRAMALVTQQGVRALPCPTDHLHRAGRVRRLADLTWDVPSLERSSVAVRERLGLWWARLRGRA